MHYQGKRQKAKGKSALRSFSVCLLPFAFCLLPCLGGCAALTNPVANGVPASLVPSELLKQPVQDAKTIPLTLLRQEPPEVYKLAPGDVLGVWIEGILGDRSQAPPVHFPQQGTQPPALGFPIPVREDGTVALPLVQPIPVRDLSLAEAEKAIQKAYTVPKQILRPDNERILVTLLRPRQSHVLVIRQDSGGLTLGAEGVIGSTKRGTGHLVALPAYENDVLSALARTGGLPGLDAVNEVVIQRGRFRGEQAGRSLLQGLEPSQPSCPVVPMAGLGGQVIRIPLRLRPGEELPFKPEDIILHTGDIVFIEARDTELFYTGGLLPPGEHVLPRDHDLDAVQAVAQVRGPLVNGAQSVSNLAGNILQPGIGFPSPSLLMVLRRTPGGGQVPIKVDLNRALRDPKERILLQPGDVLVLQETPGEAIVRYVTEILRFNLTGTFIRQRDLIGVGTLNVP
jgi:protein involved in polysaccharide export with SLBB domain